MQVIGRNLSFEEAVKCRTLVLQDCNRYYFNNVTGLWYTNLSWDNDTTQTVTVDCGPDSSSDYILSSPYFYTAVCLMYSAVFLVALIGNGLVCYVVQSTPRMKNVTNYFILNLSVGDILMTLFCVPFSFVSQLIVHYWPFGVVMCRLVNYSQAVSVLVSAYTLVAISIDRYAAIMRPLRPRPGRSAAKWVVAGVWIGAMATALPIPIMSQLEKPTDWHMLCDKSICRERWSSEEQLSQYTGALVTLQFGVPLIALAGTYARIAHAVWGGRPPGEAQRARDTRIARSKRKMIKMMVMVVIVFTVCWLPLNALINYGWHNFSGLTFLWLLKTGWEGQQIKHYLSDSPVIQRRVATVFMLEVAWTWYSEDASWVDWPALPYVWFAAHWLAMSHSCYNPLIYCYMNARYRRAFRQAFSSAFCKSGLSSHDRSCRRSSLGGDGFAMSRMSEFNMTPNNGNGQASAWRSSRRSETLQLRRVSTCTSYASARTSVRTSVRASGLTPAPTPCAGADPVRAASVRRCDFR